MSEYYSAELSQKIKRGITESLRKGKYLSDKPSYRYIKLGDQTLVIEESEASILERSTLPLLMELASLR